MTDITISNIIASFSLGQSLDIQEIAKTIPEAQVNQHETQLLTIQWEDPRIACLINADGKTMMTGAQSQEDLENGVEHLRATLEQRNIHVKKSLKPTIKHVVASTQLHTVLDLKLLQQQLKEGTISYTPESNPWLEYIPNHPNTVILVFATGALVACGPSVDDVSQQLQHLADILMKKKSEE